VGDEAVELARVEAQVEGLDLVLAQVEGDARLDAAERDARVVAAPVGGAALPLQAFAIGARKMRAHVLLARAQHDAVGVIGGECLEAKEQQCEREALHTRATSRFPSMVRRSAMMARKASMKRPRQPSDMPSMSGTRRRIAQLGSTAVTVALRAWPSRRA
jgi:hypothetical protein